MDYIEYYKTKKLLASGKTNVKLAKNNIQTYMLSLSPHTLNDKGENLCKFSTKECRALCLNMSGRGGFNMVQNARRNKTNFFVYHKQEFLNKLFGELKAINNREEKCLVRLNIVSDVDWSREFNSMNMNLGELQNITFYGYTKDPFQIENNCINNQHFTFSYSGGNWQWCERFLQNRMANVAVVFKNSIPLLWQGFKVIDGNNSDERILDEKGVIVGLKYKIPRGIKYEKNKFIIDN